MIKEIFDYLKRNRMFDLIKFYQNDNILDLLERAK